MVKIFDRIIDSYAVSHGKGVPIGNLTSQYFSNHYLSGLDHYIKEVLKVKAYARYMDDLALWNNDNSTLKNTGIELDNYAKENLKLELKPFCFNMAYKGLPFLGYILYKERVLLAKRSRKRFIKKVEKYEQNLKTGIWSQYDYQIHTMPLIAFTEHAESTGFRKKVIKEYY